MEIEIDSELLNQFTAAQLKSLGIAKDDLKRWHSTKTFNLFNLTNDQFSFIQEHLNAVVKPDKEVKHAISSMKRYKELASGKQPRAANCRSGEDVLKAYIAMHAPKFRLYLQSKKQWFGFFVDKVKYFPENNRSGDYRPAELRIYLTYSQWGEEHSCSFSWDDQDCRGKTAAQMLLMHGLVVETDEIWNHYEKSRNRYTELMLQIGLQCLASGTGFKGCRYRDDGISCKDTTYSSESFDPCIKGKPTNVVVDYPDEKELTLTETLASRLTYNRELEEIRLQLTGKGIADPYYVPANDDEAIDESKSVMVPIHPLIPVFDLRRHNRYAIHASDLQEYVYDDLVADKLVLPQVHKQILDVLVNSKGDEFKDLVDNKSGGTTVLLAGKPGVGKTLSAEVFAERTHRPLYRVQCSQLGVDPDTIEAELDLVFNRANRWNAVILLDEADIYIARRGDDINRNAIVCVFLRVLEYQTGVLFLTTNLPETVDDAIASRCIARIDIERPGAERLATIWKTLLNSTGLDMTNSDIYQLATKYDKMGGRDVKAAIKLAMIHSKELDLQTVEFVLAFHPNRGEWQ